MIAPSHHSSSGNRDRRMDSENGQGSMVVRWVSAAIVEAEKKFRRVQGWRGIEKLVRTLTLIEDKEKATAERVA